MKHNIGIYIYIQLNTNIYMYVMYDYICLYSRTSEATLQRCTPPTTEVWYAHNSVDDAESALSKVLFPTLTCGVFVFSSVSAPPPPRPPSFPSSLPPSLHHSLSHSLTHTHTHTHSLSLTHSHSLTHTLTHSLSLTHTHSLTLSLTHSHTHSLTRPSGSAFFAWQAWDNVHCQGVGCTPWRPLVSAWSTHSLTHSLFYGQSKSKEVGNMWGYPVL